METMNMKVLYDRLFVLGVQHLACTVDEYNRMKEVTWLEDEMVFNVVHRMDREEPDDYMLIVNPFKTYGRNDIVAYYCTLEDLWADLYNEPRTWLYRKMAQIYINEYVDSRK